MSPALFPSSSTPIDGHRRLASGVLALNVLIASGFSIAGLIRPEFIAPAGTHPDGAAATFALYAAARTLPLAVFALLAIWRRSVGAIIVLGALAAVVQGLDGLVGLYHADLSKSVGPLVIALVQALTVWRLNRARQALATGAREG